MTKGIFGSRSSGKAASERKTEEIGQGMFPSVGSSNATSTAGAYQQSWPGMHVAVDPSIDAAIGAWEGQMNSKKQTSGPVRLSFYTFHHMSTSTAVCSPYVHRVTK